MHQAQQAFTGHTLNGAAVGYANPAAAPDLEIPRLLDRLEKAIEHLADRADVMDNRLTGYMARSSGPEAAGQVTKTATNTGMGSRLEALGDRVHHTASRLQSLIERLEF